MSTEQKVEKKDKIWKDPPRKAVLPVLPGRVKTGEFAFNTWRVVTEPGITKDDLQDPGFWANVAHQMRPADMVSVTTDDMSVLFEGIVIAASTKQAVVQILNEHALITNKSSNTFYTVEHAGPHHMFRVRRGDDVIQAGFQTRVEAEQFAMTMVKADN